MNSEGQIVAFEPVKLEQLCPLDDGEGLYHVLCGEKGTYDLNRAISRPAPDLTYRLSLEEIPISGVLPNILATSIKTFAASKAMKGTNPVVQMFKWLYARKENRQAYKISCDKKYQQTNPQFSYTSFWGELLQAAYEMRDFKRTTIPNFAED